jgi:hypothetical protein
MSRNGEDTEKIAGVDSGKTPETGMELKKPQMKRKLMKLKLKLKLKLVGNRGETIETETL